MSVSSSDSSKDVKATDPTTTSYDAEQLVEEIETGEEETPKVDVDADYERSKQFDVAEIDQTGDKVSSGSGSSSSGAAGDPEDYLEMAKQVKQPDA